MKAGDTATYGFVQPHGYEKPHRVNFEVLETRSFTNPIDWDVNQWRIRVELNNYQDDEVVEWHDVVISIINKSEQVKANTRKDVEIGSETMIWVVDEDSEDPWDVNHDHLLRQYSMYGSIETITGAMFGLLEEIDMVFR